MPRCIVCRKRHDPPKRTKYYQKGEKVYAEDRFFGSQKRFVKKCKSEKAAKKSVMRLNA